MISNHFYCQWMIALLMMVSLTIGFHPLETQAQNRGILDQPAPEWNLKNWIHPPGQNQSVSLDDFKGKIVYLYCFQAQCPGCIQFGFPTLKDLTEHYKDNKDVVFVAVQTVFENFVFNTKNEAIKTLNQFQLNIAAAHDEGENQSGSALMKAYKTGGTPWVVIIDAKGIVRFNDFHIQPEDAIQFINGLLEETGKLSSRIGEPFESISDLRWLTPGQQPYSFQDSKLTLMRWWTDGCSYCIQSIPALQELSRKYPKEDLRFIAVYHHKPSPKTVDEAQLSAMSRLVGANDIIASDDKWNALQKEWLDSGSRNATSVTFLVDQTGTIRYVHPGMRLFHSTNPIYRQANQDMMELEKTIDSLLKPTQE